MFLLPLKIGAPKPHFSTTAQLNGNFNGLYVIYLFLIQHTDYTIRRSRLLFFRSRLLLRHDDKHEIIRLINLGLLFDFIDADSVVNFLCVI